MEGQNEVENHVLPGQARLLHKHASGPSVGGPGLGGQNAEKATLTAYPLQLTALLWPRHQVSPGIGKKPRPRAGI